MGVVGDDARSRSPAGWERGGEDEDEDEGAEGGKKRSETVSTIRRSGVIWSHELRGY